MRMSDGYDCKPGSEARNDLPSKMNSMAGQGRNSNASIADKTFRASPPSSLSTHTLDRLLFEKGLASGVRSGGSFFIRPCRRRRRAIIFLQPRSKVRVAQDMKKELTILLAGTTLLLGSCRDIRELIGPHQFLLPLYSTLMEPKDKREKKGARSQPILANHPYT